MTRHLSIQSNTTTCPLRISNKYISKMMKTIFALLAIFASASAFVPSTSAPVVKTALSATHESTTLADLDSKIQNAALQNKLTIINFTATWNPPCRMIGPLYEAVSDEFGSAQFINVDIDKNPDAASKFDISALPTFVFIKGGEEVDQFSGASEARLKETLAFRER